MKITLVTIRVPSSRLYDEVTDRWLDTYIQFRPEIPHELVVVDSDVAGAPGRHGEYASRFLVYTGGGWDCGCWQWVGDVFRDSDLLVCCNSSTYFWCKGWMERFVEEVQRHGVGLYGSMASYEFFPHIRTPCMVFQPQVIRDYPKKVTKRDDTWGFECLAGHDNFTLWCRRHGRMPWLVTWDGCYGIHEWRKPTNIFRRGDQSNILVKDRHAKFYEDSTPEGKAGLAALADSPLRISL